MHSEHKVPWNTSAAQDARAFSAKPSSMDAMQCGKASNAAARSGEEL